MIQLRFDWSIPSGVYTMPGPFFRKQGKEPKIPQIWPDGSAEFTQKGRKFRVDSEGSRAKLYSQELDGSWTYWGEAESRARLVDLITSTSGRYHWSNGQNLPQSVQNLLYPKEVE